MAIIREKDFADMNVSQGDRIKDARATAWVDRLSEERRKNFQSNLYECYAQRTRVF